MLYSYQQDLPRAAMIISIHLLRFIAAICVCWLHLSFALKSEWGFGGFGVDMFFIISGFLMMIVSEGNFSFINFMAARIMRIIPLYWSLTILIALVAIAIPSMLRTVYWDLQWFIESLFFYPGFRSEIGFRPMLKLGWTLNYEIYFYLIFAIASTICHKFRAHIVSIILLFAILVNYSGLFGPSLITFYGDLIVLNFILGMLLFKLKSYNLNLPLVTSISLIIILFIIMFYTEQIKISHKLPTTIINGIPSFFIFLLFLSINSKIETLPKIFYKSIRFLGDISYAIYLTHIYVIACITRLLDFQTMPVIVIVLLIVITASGTHIYFDQPMQKMFKKSRKVHS